MTALGVQPDIDPYAPWPLQRLRERLLQGETLYQLTGPKHTVGIHDVRELSLEALAQQVVIDALGESVIETRRPLALALDLPDAPFPANTHPDLIIRFDGKVHILEVKANRTDYNRFDNVVSAGVKRFLAGIGEEGAVPWEVEQDLMRLLLYPGLTDEVASCLLVLVDAYDRIRGGRSWTSTFSSPHTFRKTMRTKFVQNHADEILATTTIEQLTTVHARARLITCLVHAWPR